MIAEAYRANSNQEAIYQRAKTAFDAAESAYNLAQGIEDNDMVSNQDLAEAAIEDARDYAAKAAEFRTGSDLFSKHIDLLLKQAQNGGGGTGTPITCETAETYQNEATSHLAQTSAELTKVISSSGTINGYSDAASIHEEAAKTASENAAQ